MKEIDFSSSYSAFLFSGLLRSSKEKVGYFSRSVDQVLTPKMGRGRGRTGRDEDSKFQCTMSFQHARG